MQFKEQSSVMPEIPTEVVQPIEEKVVMKEVEIPAEVVVAIEPEEQAMPKIPAEVIQPIQDISAEVEISAEVVLPIEEKVAIEEVEIPSEVVVVVEPEEKAIEEYKQHQRAMAEIPAGVVRVVQPIEKEVEIPAEVIESIEGEVAIGEVAIVIESKGQARKEARCIDV